MESFRFPHKSVFNTHSQFTKERRRQGFDDFLKMLASTNPIPSEFEEFLELNEHILKYQKISRTNLVNSSEAITPGNKASLANNNINSNVISKLNGTANNVDFSNNNDNREPQYLNQVYGSENNYINNTQYDMLNDSTTKEIQDSIRKEVPKLLRSTFLVTLIMYLTCIQCKVINVYDTSVGRHKTFDFLIGIIFLF